MGRELMPCPVCGEECRTTPTAVVCTKCNYESRCANIDCTVQEMLTANVEIHNTLARRAEIGALVEEMCRNGSLNGPLKVFPSRLVDGPVRVSLVTFSGVRNGEARTLLESLRALAAEIGGDQVSDCPPDCMEDHCHCTCEPGEVEWNCGCYCHELRSAALEAEERMTVDEALRQADSLKQSALLRDMESPTNTLAAEVRRLRAAVEAVRALPRYGYDKVGKVHIVDEDDRWLNRDDVLAALEGE